jgi:hypothetical protein
LTCPGAVNRLHVVEFMRDEAGSIEAKAGKAIFYAD